MSQKRVFVRGQACVETVLVFCFLLLPVVFAIIQMATITYSYLVAHEAAFMGVRCAVVQESVSKGEDAAKFASTLILMMAGTRDIIPSNVTLWDKDPLGKGGTDDAGQQVHMFSVHQEYHQNIFFPMLLHLSPVPLMKFTTHARMVRSPDKDYLTKAYPGAAEW
ncbi:pilus assembly protein [bacterium]|nr:pilus assembly protein [bacterium]MBU4133811.1 pilus assembly protein [bacterium]